MVLVALAASQVASMVMSAYLVVPSSQHTVTYMIMGNNPGNSYFGYELVLRQITVYSWSRNRVTTMTTNILILFMTSWRFLYLPLKLTQHGIAQVVIRDTSLSVLDISGKPWGDFALLS